MSQLLTTIRNLLFMPVQQTGKPQQAPPPPICLPSTPIRALTGTAASRGLTEQDRVLMAIKLAMLIETPVKHLQVLARYHRVFLVSFVPHGRIDPIMPLTAVPLGKEHDEAYFWLAASLQAWRADHENHSVWYREARRLATRCAGFAASGLERDELEYYTQELFHSISLPQRI